MASEKKPRRGLSRRDFVKGAATGAAAATGAMALTGPARADSERKERDGDGDRGRRAECDGSHDVVLTNGRILTLDRANTIVSALAIKNGRIARVGREDELGPCARRVNLHGATVIPGL